MQVLVLNGQGVPHDIITWEDAMGHILDQGTNKRHGRAIVLEWHDRVVHSATDEWRVPSIIQFINTKYRPSKSVRYSRNHIFLRDRGQCQYCGLKVTRTEFTLDHVIPKAQAGKTTWENTVVCCVECNTRKGGRTPTQAGMRLLRAPVRPKNVPYDAAYRMKWSTGMPEIWRSYMRDTLYWDGELDNDN